MKQKLLLVVAQETKKNHMGSEQGFFLVALHGCDAIQNLQMCPLGVVVYEKTFGIVFCSFTLMAAYKAVSFTFY